ncbi:oxidoreductase [Asanoa ishikariensis]|uniref:Predicted oxidoreductase n=1 Tax=Asanoa ishikariensis TaxID=137265 RepID=A0A1H3ULX0_9ACTN|nr:aldo/keto reductase [Asanoa ishikariensis]GIF69944.1 oxidoreductase [Asanoa ishikariensis]SDZ63433.1 Predicted oxidoreductase [Asanoa ishikariensis]
MQTRPGGIGRLAGHDVSRIGYGAMQLARLRDDRPAAVALLRRAFDLGVDHVDTAHVYAAGFVNGVVRDALRPTDSVVVATKVGIDPDPGGRFPMRPAQRPDELRASIQDNLRSLGVDQLPLVYLRRFDVGARMPLDGDQVVDLEDQLAALVAMRDEGTVGAIGLSAVDLDGLKRAIPAGIASVQNAYSLLHREHEDLLELCLAEGIAWVPFYPLGGATPGLPKVTDAPAVRAAAADLGSTPAQVGLAWLLQHAPHVLLIPGTGKPEHLAANAAAGALNIQGAALDVT